MADENLVVTISMRDELSRQVTQATKSVNALGREMDEARKAAEKSGDYSQFDKLKKAYDEERRALSRLKAERDEAGRKVRSLQKDTVQAASKMGGAWKRLQGVFKNPLFTAATIAGVTLFGKKAVEAFAQAEASQLKLVEAYRKFDAIGNVPIESMRALASELQSLTGTDDDLLAAAAGTLARFELSGDAIQRLLPLVNDFAILTGRDVVDASEAIGKAFMGNARALKELGIDFRRTGDTGKDFETILAALEDKAGGAGEAFGETAQGGLARAQAAFSDLQETIGGTLIPVLTGMLKIVEPAVKVFQNMPGPLQSIVSVIGFLGVALLALGPRIAMIVTGMKAAGIQAGFMGTAMGRLTTRIGAATTGLFAFAVAGQAVAASNESGKAITLESAYATDEYAQALRDIVQPGVAGAFGNFISGTAAAIIPFNTKLEDAKNVVGQFDTGLVKLVTDNNIDRASAQLQGLVANAAEYGATTEDVIKLLPGLKQALDSAGLEVDKTGRIVKKTEPYIKSLAQEWMGTVKATEMAARALGDYRDKAYSASGAADALRVANQRASEQLERLQGALAGVGEEIARQQAMRAYEEAMQQFIANPSEEAAEAVSAAMATAAQSIEDPLEAARFTKTAVDDIRTAASDAGMKLNPKLDESMRKARGQAVLLDRQIDRATRARTVQITNRFVDSRDGGAVRRAAGGWVGGQTGGPTSDTVPAWLSRGEYVLRGGAAAALRAAIGDAGMWSLNHADRTMPSFLDSPMPPIVVPGGAEPALVGAGAPVINIGEIKADSGIDVQAEVLWAMRRAERIRRERG